MHLISVASSFPKLVFTQSDCLDVLKASSYWESLSSRSLSILQKVLEGDNGIRQRHFAADALEQVWQRSAQELNESYEREAPKLGADAVRQALDRAGLLPREVDILLVSTCTGYLCPGLASHMIEQLGLRRDVFAQDLTGHGCGAAIPLVQLASAYSKLYPEARIVTAEVEVCSAAFYLDDDIGVLISACLFGDGASAQVWSSTGGDYAVDHFRSVHRPDCREALRFVNHQGQLKNRLHKSVPSIVAESVKELYEQETGETDRRPVLHGGGRDVLDALEGIFDSNSLQPMRQVLKDCGNMSSPSLFVALERILEAADLGNESLWLCGFGAGFSAHCACLPRVH
ncbi:MAG: stilbene synthase [Verrucomicrobiota bacterium]